MKFFISHKQEDAYIANRIANELHALNISFYLDLLDFHITRSGKELTDHIKANLNDCTDIIVIISQNTKLSQWVPFEVGMSAQINMPTATFLQEEVALPEFLEYWPRLKYPSDIRKYIAVRNHFSIQRRTFNESFEFSSHNKNNLNNFYSALKTELGKS